MTRPPPYLIRHFCRSQFSLTILLSTRLRVQFVTSLREYSLCICRSVSLVLLSYIPVVYTRAPEINLVQFFTQCSDDFQQASIYTIPTVFAGLQFPTMNRLPLPPNPIYRLKTLFNTTNDIILLKTVRINFFASK